MKPLKCLFLTGLIFLFVSCKEEKKYPYASADFRTELKIRLDKVASAVQIPNNQDTSITHFLYRDCSKEELIKMLSFDGPVVRVMAYNALVERREKDYFSILLRHLDDTAKITWWYFDDAADEFMVSDMMIQKALPAMNKHQKNKLVDKVLMKHPYLITSNWMIQDIEPNAKYYSIIKSRTTEKSDRCGYPMGANYALSKFKKPQDVPFLKSNFREGDEACSNWTFRAIERFPNPAFSDILTDYFETDIKKKKQFGSDDFKYYYRALAAYKSVESLKILTALTKKETYPYDYYLSFNKEFIFKAIHKHNCPLYKQLYAELKSQMEDHVLDGLDDLEYDEWEKW
jgi:hypothetical protein